MCLVVCCSQAAITYLSDELVTSDSLLDCGKWGGQQTEVLECFSSEPHEAAKNHVLIWIPNYFLS